MRAIGGQFESVVAAFREPAQVYYAGDEGTGGDRGVDPRLKAIVQIIVTLVVLAAGVVLLLGDYGDAEKKGAFALIGAVVGYWLH